MADQYARQDQNRFPALLGHTGTSGTAETQRIVADTLGQLNTTTTQNVTADSNNSYSGSILAGGTYTGTATSTLGIAGIQTSLKTDQNCTIYVEQSPDGTNWDLVDDFNYYTGLNNFGVTTQAINSYTRTRVVNNGTADTTYFRLQTALCPIVEAVPRALDEDGNMKIGIKSMSDGYGFGVENTPTDEMRTVTPFRLIGATFVGGTLDTNFWTASAGTTGTITQTNGQITLYVGTTPANPTSVQSVRTARYVSASANRFRGVLRVPDIGTAGNIRRWGAFGTGSGAFFELDDQTLGVVTRVNGTDTRIASGNFNGNLGDVYKPGTTVNTYEIYWTNSSAWFMVNGKLIHKTTGSVSPWSDSVNLPIRVENNNSGTYANNVTLEARVMSIVRLGAEQTQPTSKFQSNAGTVICKYGAGNVHGLVISNVSNTSVVSVYDSIGTSASVIWSSGGMGAQTTPFGLDFHNIPFFTGLTLEIKTANSNALVAYE